MRPRSFLEPRWWQVLLVAFLGWHLTWGLRIPRIDHPDELWSLAAIKGSFSQVISYILGYDSHPPLYYLLIKIWSSVAGHGISSGRLLSYVFGVSTLCVFALYLRRRQPLGFIAPLLLLATNPLFTYYAATIRPYALVVFLAAVVLFASLELRSGDRFPEALPISEPEQPARFWLEVLFYGSCLLLGLTHYYGWLYVLILLAFEFVGRRISSSRLPSIIIALLLFIWPLMQFLFGSLDQQIKSNAWVNVVPVISTLNNAFMGLFPAVLISKQPAYIVSLLLFVSLVAVLFGSELKRGRQQLGWLGLITHNDLGYMFSSLLLIYLASLVVDLRVPFSTPYYFLVGLPAVALLFGFAVSGIRDRFGRFCAIALVVVIVAVQLILAHERLLKG